MRAAIAGTSAADHDVQAAAGGGRQRATASTAIFKPSRPAFGTVRPVATRKASPAPRDRAPAARRYYAAYSCVF